MGLLRAKTHIVFTWILHWDLQGGGAYGSLRTHLSTAPLSLMPDVIATLRDEWPNHIELGQRGHGLGPRTRDVANQVIGFESQVRVQVVGPRSLVPSLASESLLRTSLFPQGKKQQRKGWILNHELNLSPWEEGKPPSRVQVVSLVWLVFDWTVCPTSWLSNSAKYL